MGIIKRKSKKKTAWNVEVYHQGERVSSKAGFTTKAEAQKWHDVEKAKYCDPSFRVNPYAKMKLNEVFEIYKSQRIPELRASTRQTQTNRHWCIVDSPIFTWSMNEIDAFALDRWIEWLKSLPTSKAKGRKSFRQELNCLRAILNWYHHYLNEKFVVPVVKRHTKAIYYKEVVARKPNHFLQVDEVIDWLSWLQKNQKNKVYYRLAKFMVVTGCRIGEAAGLFWDVVDLKTGMIPIIRTVWWDHTSKQPQVQENAKNKGAIRNIGLPEEIRLMLIEMKAECGIGPVFCTVHGEVIRYNAIQTAFNKGFKALGLPFSATHICRHTFATLALTTSRDIVAVQAALGHEDIRQTQHYAKKCALLDGKVNSQVAQLIEFKARN